MIMLLSRLVPSPIRSLIKLMLRRIAEVRLQKSMDLATAERWAERIKDWPAFYSQLNPRAINLVDGLKMEVGIVDVVERHIRTEGKWDPIVGLTIKKLLQTGDTFFDIGSNIGYFTLMASRIVGEGGRVVAFEPSVRALQRLTRHIDLNQLENVLVLSCACSDTSKLDQIHHSSDGNTGATAIGRTEYSIGRTELIHTRRIDDICAELSLMPQVIKVDVEGYEFHVLRGAEQTLRNAKPIVVLELTDSFLKQTGGSSEQLIGFMQSLGYDCFRLFFENGVQSRKLNVEDLHEHQFEVLFISNDCTRVNAFLQENAATTHSNTRQTISTV